MNDAVAEVDYDACIAAASHSAEFFIELAKEAEERGDLTQAVKLRDIGEFHKARAKMWREMETVDD